VLYSLSLATAATIEPVTVNEAKNHLRVDHDSEDDLISTYITAARESLEMACNRSFVTQTWDLILDQFPRYSCIYLPRSPVASLTSITYYDTANASQTLTLATYVDQNLSALPAELHLKYGYSWPSTYSRPNAVTVRYVAGAGIDSVPAGIKHAILVTAGDMYEHRASVGVGTVAYELAELTARNLRAKYEIPDMSGFM
jgi:uncharacterized phiE125 gp8 family phage protein